MIIIDYKDTRPIYEQIVEKFKLLILKGGMQPDEQMPSVRNLAIELSINPNTIQKAYAELERQGFIYTVKGRGNFVSGDICSKNSLAMSHFFRKAGHTAPEKLYMSKNL